jgi:hypothetical protein
MSAPGTTTRSLGSLRTRTIALRALAYGLVAILCVAGLRAIFAKPPAPPPARTIVRASEDLGAQGYAESFARAYLTWDATRPEDRAQRLRAFGAGWLGDDGGVNVADGGSQAVQWTTVVGARQQDRAWVVTVAAQTSAGLRYLAVPVTRNGRGFLTLAGYPALVGPPATASETTAPGAQQDDVSDPQLSAVVRRAVGNYLGGAKANLLADLAPDAVVSLPPQPLALTDVQSTTWVVPNRQVEAEVVARDRQGSTWTLDYELSVVKRDRWYVRSIEIDPTFHNGQGGS